MIKRTQTNANRLNTLVFFLTLLSTLYGRLCYIFSFRLLFGGLFVIRFFFLWRIQGDRRERTKGGKSRGLSPPIYYSRIFVTTPAPTVRPPSRIAKRVPSSRAIGAPSVTVNFTLSPGITISTFSASSTVPVTSVVRM